VTRHGFGYSVFEHDANGIHSELTVFVATFAGTELNDAALLLVPVTLSSVVLGLALLMTETLGSTHLPHTEERIGELMMYTSLTRAVMRAGEADAKLDEWGVMCPDSATIETTRNLFMTAYPRMIEILQLLGSSSFMITPSEADLKGPLGGHIEQYLATDNSSARDRIKLFRLAWDVAGSSFGSRQVLYERFFASDPLTRARALAAIFPKNEVMERVLDFLRQEDTP